MTSSKQLAGLISPTVVAVIVSELPFVQPRLYDDQIPPGVYLSGVLLFVAGLAVVRAHNRWRRDWTVLVTLSGWFALVFGLIRMFAASSYRQGFSNTSLVTLVVFEGILLIVGVILTFKAYSRENP